MFNPRKIQFIIGLLLVLGFTSYVGVQVFAFARWPILKVESPKCVKKSLGGCISVVEKRKILVKGRVSPGDRLFLNGQPIVVDQQGSWQKEILLVSGENILNFRSVNQRDKETSVQRRVFCRVD